VSEKRRGELDRDADVGGIMSFPIEVGEVTWRFVDHSEAILGPAYTGPPHRKSDKSREVPFSEVGQPEIPLSPSLLELNSRIYRARHQPCDR